MLLLQELQNTELPIPYMFVRWRLNLEYYRMGGVHTDWCILYISFLIEGRSSNLKYPMPKLINTLLEKPTRVFKHTKLAWTSPEILSKICLNIRIYKILWNTCDLLKGDLPCSELLKAASLPMDVTGSAPSCTLTNIQIEQSAPVHPRSSLQHVCSTISGLICSSSRSWEESRLLMNPLPTIYDPAHYSKCHKCAIAFICKELLRNTAVPWPSRSTLSLSEPLVQNQKGKFMKNCQNKSLLKEFPNMLSRAKQFWFSYLSGVSFLTMLRMNFTAKWETYPQVCWEANWKYLRNKTKELYMERLKGRRHITGKHTCN